MKRKQKLSPYRRLKAAVKSLLVPYILSRGFQEDTRKLGEEAPSGHQSFRFLRWQNNNLELLEIQFDKYRRAAFAIEFGIVPPEGVYYYGYHYPQEKAYVCISLRAARLTPSRICKLKRFALPLLKIPVLRNPSPERVVQRAIELFPQVETWLRQGVKGPNVYVMPESPEMRKPPQEKLKAHNNASIEHHGTAV